MALGKKMDQEGFFFSLRFNLGRQSSFSFKCQVCGACCHNKDIAVSFYEAQRLARCLGLRVKEFFIEYVEKNKVILRRKQDGSCIFLRPEGCGVYPDRPLVCRLFPLGLLEDANGQELFGVMPLHPDCLGLLGEEGTVASYLNSQGAGPYLRAHRVSFKRLD